MAESFHNELNENGNKKAGVLADTLMLARALLNEGKSPSRKVGEIDNLCSHFILESSHRAG